MGILETLLVIVLLIGATWLWGIGSMWAMGLLGKRPWDKHDD
jgi:hypothetical protein